jgi:hypothetical protein
MTGSASVVQPFSWRLAVMFVVLVATLMISPLVDVVLLALVIWALRGGTATIQALELSVLVKYMNPGLVRYDLYSGALLWLVIIVAALRVASEVSPRQLRRLVPVAVYVVIAALLSVAVSPAVAISLMKLLTFALVVCTVVMSADTLSASERESLQTWMLTLGITAIALSALTLLQPGIAYLRNGSGLQGILNHPQSLGSFAAPFAAVLLAKVLLQRKSAGPILLVATGLCWTVMFLTQARTAAFAATIGTLAALGARLWTGRRRASDATTGRIVALIAAGCLAIVVTATVTGKVGSAVTGFLLKRSGEQQIGAAFKASRGYGIESQWANFLDAPLTGHGFGVYPDGVFPSGVTRIWGIPISAPVEKGFVPTAVLEESGLLGALAFAALVFSLWLGAWRSRDPLRIAAFVSCVGVNVGEAIILSPGGIGLHIWVLMALAAASPAKAALAASVRAPAMPTARQRFPNVMR